LAAFVGGLLGVGTYVAGQISSSSKERRSGQAAVSVVIEELRANRRAVNEAMTPPPPGPPANELRLSISVFPQLRVQLADLLPYPLLARTYSLYGELAEILATDLRSIDPRVLDSIRGRMLQVEDELRPHARH